MFVGLCFLKLVCGVDDDQISEVSDKGKEVMCPVRRFLLVP